MNRLLPVYGLFITSIWTVYYQYMERILLNGSYPYHNTG